MPRILIAFTLFAFLGAKPPEKELKVYTKFADFKPLLEKDNDTTYVINFWATWCKPCVEELPFFDSLASQYSNQKVKVLLVSIDFDNMVESRVKPFIESKKVKSQVVVFDDAKQHIWIPQIDKNWSGAIPATYIYRGKKSAFYEKEFTYTELENALKPFIK